MYFFICNTNSNVLCVSYKFTCRLSSGTLLYAEEFVYHHLFELMLKFYFTALSDINSVFGTLFCNISNLPIITLRRDSAWLSPRLRSGANLTLPVPYNRLLMSPKSVRYWRIYAMLQNSIRYVFSIISITYSMIRYLIENHRSIFSSDCHKLSE